MTDLAPRLRASTNLDRLRAIAYALGGSSDPNVRDNAAAVMEIAGQLERDMYAIAPPVGVTDLMGEQTPEQPEPARWPDFAESDLR